MNENKQKALLRNGDDLIAAVEEYDFLPGFSVEELCAPELWFVGNQHGLFSRTDR